MIDTLTLSRELTKVGIPSAHADAIAVSAHGTRAETRGVLIPTGRGIRCPGHPAPPLEREGDDPKHPFFRFLIVQGAGIGREGGHQVAIASNSGSSRAKPVTKDTL